MRYLLLAFWILSWAIEYSELKGGITFDQFGAYILEAISIAFKVFAAIWLYKDIIGWNNFENPEGFSLKRKK